MRAMPKPSYPPADSRYADLDRPSRWSAYRPGLCEGCWSACCRLPVDVDAADLQRLGLLSAAETRGSLKPAARRLLAAGQIETFHAPTGAFQLGKTAQGDCIYLDPVARRCRVYETRPAVCGAFPAIGPRPGHCPARARPAAKAAL